MYMENCEVNCEENMVNSFICIYISAVQEMFR